MPRRRNTPSISSAITHGQNAYNSSTYAAPARLRCNRCRTVKNSVCFAAHRLAELASYGTNIDPTQVALIACKSCTGGQVTELHCYMCEKDMGLAQFSKAQRRNPDRAICWSCAKKREQEDAESYDFHADNPSDDAYGSSDSHSDSDDSDDDVSLLTGSRSTSLALGSTNATYATRSHGGVSLVDTPAPSTAAPSLASGPAPSLALHPRPNGPSTSAAPPPRPAYQNYASRYGDDDLVISSSDSDASDAA